VRALGGRLGTIFFKGLIAVLPISATLGVFIWIANIFENFFSGPIKGLLRLVGPPLEAGKETPFYVTGMGLVTGFLLIFLVGLVVNLWFTQQALAWGENLLQGLPLAKTILHGVKDLMGFFNRDKSQAPNQVVVVEINGLKMLGLVTRQSLVDLPPEINEGDRVAVFFPMSYQMGGFTMFIPRSRISPVSMPMEDAMRFILTAGVKTHRPADTVGNPGVNDPAALAAAIGTPSNAPSNAPSDAPPNAPEAPPLDSP
jgi:uncharacterized membrane protein